MSKKIDGRLRAGTVTLTGTYRLWCVYVCGYVWNPLKDLGCFCLSAVCDKSCKNMKFKVKKA